ncbi:MAG: DUF1049 domain-containing protein [Elainella sp. Prado103]|jgi:uncharacterized integral membrane protein|nr:DUF1049 domain-containing protein [Elainella sp. Prado103]
MTRFLTSIVVAIWISTIALIAIQNATPISLQFLGLRTIEIPIGLVLAFSVSLGMMGTALVLSIWQSARKA